MVSIHSILNTGSKSLSTNQTVINTTSHNISNVNTPGYSRQRALLETNDPFRTNRGQLGTGVGVQSIDRANTKYIQKQLVDQIPDTAYHKSSHQMLSRVEDQFHDFTGDDIHKVMIDFFDSFSQLSQRPDDVSLREDVRRKGKLLVEKFNGTDSSLQRMQREFNMEIEGNLKKVNSLTEKISELNRRIAVEEASGHQANDLRDKQEEAVRELSGIVDIDYFNDSKGFLNVWMDSGEPLVSGKQSYDMVAMDRADGMKNIGVDRKGSIVNVTENLRSGELAAIVDVRDSSIAEYRNRIDLLAETLAEEVNDIHSGGYGLDLLQRDFFERIDPTESFSASNIRIHGDIEASLDAIAAGETSDPDEIYGDNRNAIEIAALIENSGFFGTGETFADYYQTVVGDVGHEVSEARSSMELASSKEESLMNFRESLAGVNIDEELINLDKFKKAYEASSRIINIAGEMLDTVLALKR